MAGTCFLVLRSDLTVVSKHELREQAVNKAEKLASQSGQKFYLAEVLAEVSVLRFPTQWRNLSESPEVTD